MPTNVEEPMALVLDRRNLTVILSEDRQSAIEKQADEIISSIISDPNNIELADGLGNLGQQAQIESARFLDRKMDTVLKKQEDLGQSPVAKNLLDLRRMLSAINPAEAEGSLLYKIFGWIPFLGQAIKNGVLTGMYARYESIGDNIDAVRKSLEAGKAGIEDDNIELGKVDLQLQAILAPLRENQELGNILVAKLRNAMDNATSETIQKFQDILAGVQLRLQDLYMLEQVLLQFLVSIRITRKNNHELAQSVGRTITTGMVALKGALSIRAALDSQMEVARSTQMTQEFIGRTIASNAKMINEQTGKIAEMSTSSVIKMDQIRLAKDELLQALDTIARAQEESIKVTGANIAELREMSQELREKGLPGVKEAKIKSIEVIK